MKTMTKTFFVLGLLACSLSISSAENSTVSTTNETTLPGGTSSNSTSSSAPSMTDIENAAEPSLEASVLDTPTRWLLDLLYYIWSYGIEEPAFLAVDLAIVPITLPLKIVTIPLNLVFGDFLKPVNDFLGNQYQLTKNAIWFIILESISYGSGATADTVSEAMQLALNGIIQFFTDIGLPVANSAEKLAQLTDQIAKSRRRRSISSAVGDLGSGVGQLIIFPFTLIGGIFSIFTYPFRAIFGLVTFPFYLIFGSSSEENMPSILLLTDMSTQELTSEVLESIWKFMRQTGFTELDSIATQLMESDMIPKNIRNIFTEFDSVYRVAKMLGYIE